MCHIPYAWKMIDDRNSWIYQGSFSNPSSQYRRLCSDSYPSCMANVMQYRRKHRLSRFGSRHDPTMQLLHSPTDRDQVSISSLLKLLDAPLDTWLQTMVCSFWHCHYHVLH